jgi:hypothetical protein
VGSIGSKRLKLTKDAWAEQNVIRQIVPLTQRSCLRPGARRPARVHRDLRHDRPQFRLLELFSQFKLPDELN